jgi:hypothetical protein
VGGNFEAGVALNVRNGRYIGYLRGGNSMGGGASYGLEVAAQSGSLNDLVSTDDLNANVKELEISGPVVGGNLVVGRPKWVPSGGGLNAGGGAGGFLNFTSGTAVSPATGNLYQGVAQSVKSWYARQVAASADRSKYGSGVR